MTQPVASCDKTPAHISQVTIFEIDDQEDGYDEEDEEYEEDGEE